jgi:hypothetical protein
MCRVINDIFQIQFTPFVFSQKHVNALRHFEIKYHSDDGSTGECSSGAFVQLDDRIFKVELQTEVDERQVDGDSPLTVVSVNTRRSRDNGSEMSTVLLSNGVNFVNPSEGKLGWTPEVKAHGKSLRQDMSSTGRRLYKLKQVVKVVQKAVIFRKGYKWKPVEEEVDEMQESVAALKAFRPRLLCNFADQTHLAEAGEKVVMSRRGMCELFTVDPTDNDRQTLARVSRHQQVFFNHLFECMETDPEVQADPENVLKMGARVAKEVRWLKDEMSSLKCNDGSLKGSGPRDVDLTQLNELQEQMTAMAQQVTTILERLPG